MQADTKRLAERHWMNMYAGQSLADAWTSRMVAGLKRAADQGLKRVAIYGAGTHTRGVGNALVAPPVEVVAIIDDNPDLRGKRLWNFPIVSPSDAISLDIDGVILSSNSMEDRLWESSATLRERGVPVIRLYEGVQGMWRGDRDSRIPRAGAQPTTPTMQSTAA
jgi:FlaA1/EpsC-like NDP-sugar epimerase